MTRFQESKGRNQQLLGGRTQLRPNDWMKSVFIECFWKQIRCCQFQTEDEHIHPGSSKTVCTKPSDEVPNRYQVPYPQNKPWIFSTYWQYMVDTKHGLCYCVENVFLFFIKHYHDFTTTNWSFVSMKKAGKEPIRFVKAIKVEFKFHLKVCGHIFDTITIMQTEQQI